MTQKKGQLYRDLSPEMRMQVTSLMRSYLSTQDIIDDDERISAKALSKDKLISMSKKQSCLKSSVLYRS